MYPSVVSLCRRSAVVLLLLLSLHFVACRALGLDGKSSAEEVSAPQASEAEPVVEKKEDLRDTEIRLLKRRLADLKERYDESATARLVFETQLEVSALRGLFSFEKVDYAPMTPAVIEGLVDDSIARHYPGRQLELSTWLGVLFGAYPEGMDLIEVYRGLMGEQAAGVYDPFTQKLYVDEDFALDSST